MAEVKVAGPLTIVAAAFFIGAPVPADCGALPKGWQSSRPEHARIVNVLTLHSPSAGWAVAPSWNGSPVTDKQVKEYLGLIKVLNPRPLFLLVVPPNPKCDEVQFYRHLADEILDCEAGDCAQVTL